MYPFGLRCGLMGQSVVVSFVFFPLLLSATILCYSGDRSECLKDSTDWYRKGMSLSLIYSHCEAILVQDARIFLCIVASVGIVFCKI